MESTNESSNNSRFLKTFKRVWKVLYVILFALLITIAGIVAASILNIPGNYKLLVVLSGSMEPSIQKGSLVAVKPESEYKVGDVITVSEPANPDVSLTHRIVEVQTDNEQTLYVTKGDANEDADSEERPGDNVLGKVKFSIPYLGYLINFAKTREGLIFLIVIPATLIIYSELVNIKNEIVKILTKKKDDTKTIE